MEKTLKELFYVMKQNREKCPWTREKDIKDYIGFVKDELDEILEAVNKDDLENLEEEIGDTFGALFLLSILAEEKGLDTKHIIENHIKKFKNRKPWVYSDMEGIDTPEKAVEEWKKVKQNEKLHKK